MSSDRNNVHNSDIPVLCRSCEARHRGMCGVLEPEQLIELSRTTHKARHQAGSELIGDGAEVRSYANVMRGVVKLTKMLEDGRQQVVGLQFAPDFLGRLFAREEAVTAEAASAVELCVVPKGTLEHLIEKSPALQLKLMQQTFRELDEARNWMLTLGRKTAQEKVASFFHLLATHLDPCAEGESSVRFELPLTRTEIADFLGLTIETVSRQITKLRQLGAIVVTHNRDIEVPKLKRLESLCG
jgi:CRP/FNR family transcriptional regulator